MTTQQVICEFLALPDEAMPSAIWINSMEDTGSPYSHLRDYVKPPHLQRMNHLGETILLRADRPEWREGVTVTLT